MKKKIAILDCFAGISGDMTLGALIDSEVPVTYLRSELTKLKISGWDLKVKTRMCHQIKAKHITVIVKKDQKARDYTTIVKLLESSGLSEQVKLKSIKAFTILGKAEAKIHGVKLNHVHFHEVGAIDSIIDLVGSMIGFEFLGFDKIYHTPIPLGTGFIKTEHGNMPIPSPATIEILKGRSVVRHTSEYEMTTPTGATLIKTISNSLLPENLIYEVKHIGYGAGNTQTELWPNTLRLITGITNFNRKTDELIMVETNIDDMNPEFYPYLMERLYKTGARDVYLSQVIMKKGRPGILLSVLIDPEKLDNIEQEIFLNTTTIGIRKYHVNRVILKRESKNFKTEFGDVKVKSLMLNDREIIRPEFEECKKIAEENGMSIVEVYKRIEKSIFKLNDSK